MIVKLKNRYNNGRNPNNYRQNFIAGRIYGNELPNCYGAPTIMIQNQLICVEQLFDKVLFTRKNVDVFNHPYSNNTKLYTVQKNKPVGTVFSYVDSGGNVWLQCQPSAPMQSIWVKADNTAFSLSAIQDQGGQTYDDIEQQNQSWWESITQGAGNLIQDTISPTTNALKWGIPLVIGYIVYKDFISPRSKK